MKKVVFICTHNSARSQMAEGLLRHLYGEEYEAFSAGTSQTGVNPFAVKVMEEIGIDISGARSKGIDEFTGTIFDYVITVCDHARQICPFLPAAIENLHAGFEDPAAFEGTDEAKLMKFREVRDETKRWIGDYFGRKD
jgi:arsenate reductase